MALARLPRSFSKLDSAMNIPIWTVFTAWLVGTAAFSVPWVSRLPSTSGLTSASRPSLTRRRATHPPLPLVCVAKSSASAEENTAPDTSVDVAAVPLGGTTGGCVRRLYETWRWKDRNINFRVEGKENAPPVLLIHGFGASVGHFRKNFPFLVGEGYRVYAVDLLGFGASDKPKEIEYSLELWQEMLTDFIKEMSRDSSEQWIVMGNSLGGLLTLMLVESLQEGRKVRAGVLFNTAGGLVSFRESELPFYFLPIKWFFDRVVFGPVCGPFFFANFRTEENVRSVLKQVYAKGEVDDELVKLLIAPSNDDGACEVFLKVLTGPPGPTPSSLLKKIEGTKILAIWGEDDPWTPLDTGLHSGASLYQYLDSFELVVLPQTGHCPHDENPELCHAALLPWLKALA
ncbi:unnamed protein product [Ascophyllum nodosum]